MVRTINISNGVKKGSVEQITEGFVDGQTNNQEESSIDTPAPDFTILEDNTFHGVKLVTVGGSISYDPSEAIFSKKTEESKVARYLRERIKPHFDIDEQIIAAPNCEDIGRKERRRILKAASQSKERVIIIPHGREKVKETAQFLASHQKKIHDKIIVLVSSRYPMHGYTDARFNLGFGIGVAAKMKEESAIAIADAGKLFSNNVSLDNDRFEELLSPSSNPFANLREAGFILTGGTIDGRPNFPKDGFIEMREESALPAYLDFLRLHFKFQIEEICMRDSRDIRKVDQNNVWKVIRQIRPQALFVTHGTYTMPRTARKILKKLWSRRCPPECKDKLVGFTGSMVPLKGFEETDADFNIGFALGVSSQLLRVIEGRGHVFVAMNARVFDPRFLEKNEKLGVFEATDEPVTDEN